MYTVKKASEITGIAETTIKLYCRNGKFPNAVKEKSAYGDSWMIPEGDLNFINKSRRGRPKKSKAEEKSAADASGKSSRIDI